MSLQTWRPAPESDVQFIDTWELEGHKGEVTSVSAASCVVASCCVGGLLNIWSLCDGQNFVCTSSIQLNNGGLTRCKVADDAAFASCGDGSVLIYDLNSEHHRFLRPKGDRFVQNDVCIFSGTIYSGTDDGKLWVSDLRAPAPNQHCSFSAPVTSVNRSEDSLFAGCADGRIHVADIRTMQWTLLGEHDAVLSNLSVCGYRLLSSSCDGAVRIWNIRPYCRSDRLILQHHQPSFRPDLEVPVLWRPSLCDENSALMGCGTGQWHRMKFVETEMSDAYISPKIHSGLVVEAAEANGFVVSCGVDGKVVAMREK